MENKKIPIQVIRLSVIALVIIAIIAFKTISSNMIEDKVDTLLANSPSGTITYEDASMDLIGFEVRIGDITVQSPSGKPLHIDEIVINAIDQDNKVPEYMDVEIHGIEGDMQALQINHTSAQLLKMLDLKTLTSDMSFEYSFDKEKGILEIEDISLEVDNLAKISFDAQLEGIDSLERFSAQLMRNPQSIKIADASLEYENFADKELVTASLAVTQRQDYADAKAKILEGITQNMKQSKSSGDEIAYEFMENLHDFIEDPKSIEFSVAPEEAVSFAQLRRAQTAQDAQELLNFKMEVN